MYKYTFLFSLLKIMLFALKPALGHIWYLQLDSERNFHIIAYLNLDFQLFSNF